MGGNDAASWQPAESNRTKKRRLQLERRLWLFGGGNGGKAAQGGGKAQSNAAKGGKATSAQGGGGQAYGAEYWGGKSRSWGGGGVMAGAQGGQGGGKAQGGKALGGKGQSAGGGGKGALGGHGVGGGGGGRNGEYRPRHWETPDGVHVKCENVECARASELASQAGWGCPGCEAPYLWRKFWEELCDARRSTSGPEAMSDAPKSSKGEEGWEAPRAPYTGRYGELIDDEHDEEEVGDPPKPPDKGKKEDHYKAPEADEADRAAKEAQDAWTAVHETFKKKRKQFQVSQGTLQGLLLKVQKQLDWMDKQKEEVADCHAEVEAAAANFCKKEAIQKTACVAAVNKIANTMASARTQATDAEARFSEDDRKAEEDKAGKEVERLKREAKEARVRRVKQDEQAAAKAAAAEASAEEARKEGEAQERRRAEEKAANEALEKALGKSSASAASSNDGDNSGGSAASTDAGGAAAGQGAPAAAAAVDGIEVSHENVGRWKEAMVHWIWDAGPDDEVPSELLTWTRVGGADDEADAKGFEVGAKAARDALARKREEHMAAGEQAKALAAAGEEEGARQMAWDNEVYGSELRSSFGAWMGKELDSRLGELLEKRKAAVDAGTAVRAVAFTFSTAPVFVSTPYEGFAYASGVV